MRTRPARLGSLCATTLVAVTGACVSVQRGQPTQLDDRDIAVYRAIAESLYLGSAQGRSIALSAQLLDTSCSSRACPPLEERWGLDSLWFAGDDRTEALALRRSLLARVGRALTFGPTGVGNLRIIPVDAATLPAPTADSATWRAFQSESRTAAAIRFSPAGFSRDGKRALVVTRMTCGPRCGHWLVVSLQRRDRAWIVADLLLVASDRAGAVQRHPSPRTLGSATRVTQIPRATP